MDHEQQSGDVPPAGWYVDPTGRHQQRYFDGRSWSEHVADDGIMVQDPPGPLLPATVPPPPLPPRTPPSRGQAHPVGAGSWADGSTPPGGVTMDEAVRRCLTKYADFSGRAPRSEYWWFILAYGLLQFALGFVLVFAGATDDTADAIAILVALGLTLPILAAGARRLHDIGRSGWYQLVAFIPLVGGILLIVWLTTAGTKEPNAFGPPVEA